MLEGASGIKYPDIKWPGPYDAHSWALLPTLESEWVRVVGAQAQIGIEPKVIDDLRLGHALDNFINDDGGLFLPMRLKSFKGENGLHVKRRLFIRLNWELNAPNLPGQIADELQNLRKVAICLKFRTYSGYFQAQDLFLSARDNVHAAVRKDPALLQRVLKGRSFFQTKFTEFPKLHAAWEEYSNITSLS